MKLFYATPSPFARKVRLLILEKGISGIETCAVSPFDIPADLVAVNPLSKVPALVLDDGSVLYDSPVICEYLDATQPGTKFIPASGAARWTVLRRQALADGLMDTTMSIAIELNRRAPHERSAQWVERWCTTIRRTVRALEQEIPTFGADADMAHIALASALGYVDLRAGALVAWREECPRLASWYAAFERRPSMQATRPQ